MMRHYEKNKIQKSLETLQSQTLVPFVSFVSLVLFFPVQAEISLSSIGNEQLSINDGEYAITQDLGVTAGNNLFHSFHSFNINQGETAAFSGAAHIENVISRVTGGSPSNINGMIRNSIPGADTYLMNPAGIMFGEHAQLDVQGGFHTTTADYLKFEDGERYYANAEQASSFSSASPAAFGFLDNAHGKISMTGRSVVSEQLYSGLRVNVGENLSLVGGDIEISQGAYSHIMDADGMPRTQKWGSLTAPQGRINLTSIQGTGESDAGYIKAGRITISDHSLLNTSGAGGGSVSIRAGELTMDSSDIEARTLGAEDGGIVSIQANTIRLQAGAVINASTQASGRGSDIELNASNDILLQGATISADALDVGAGGNISLEAENNVQFTGAMPLEFPTSMTLTSVNSISLTTQKMPDGNAGKIGQLSIKADDITVAEDARIFSDNWGTHIGVNIQLEARHRVLFQGAENSMFTFGTPSLITLTTNSALDNAGDGGHLHITAPEIVFEKAGVDAFTFGTGTGGTIALEANTIELNAGSFLNTSTYGHGDGGNITIQTSDTLALSGINPIGFPIAQPSSIYSSSQANSAFPFFRGYTGSAGQIEIKAGNLALSDGAQIQSSTIADAKTHSGQAGNIDIQVAGDSHFDGVNPYGETVNGFGTGVSARVLGVGNNTGAGGEIKLETGSLWLSNGARIESSTNSQQSAGTINIMVHEDTLIEGNSSQIELRPYPYALLPVLQPSPQDNFLQQFSPGQYNYSASGLYADSNSQAIPAGHSGNIDLHTGSLTLRNQGQISSNSAGGGTAGHINIQAQQISLDDSAQIFSKSVFINRYKVATQADRDQQFILRGELIEVADTGVGKTAHYINTGNAMNSTQQGVYQVASRADLNNIPNEFVINEGRMVRVDDVGDGSSALFMYDLLRTNYETLGLVMEIANWVKVDETPSRVLTASDERITKPNPADSDVYFTDAQTTFSPGTRIRLMDDNGGFTDYVSTQVEAVDQQLKHSYLSRINYNRVASLANLEQTLKNTDIAEINGEHFIYYEAWFILDPKAQVADLPAMSELTLPSVGSVLTLETPNSDGQTQFINAGNNWLPMRHTQHAADLAQRDTLMPQAGDFVKVTDAGNGRQINFFYADNQWHEQIKSGDAGHIYIHANDLTLQNGSAVSTEAISSGGGQIDIQAQGLLRSEHSQISSSVWDGSGDGGNLNINSRFLVQNHAPIIARAVEGSGGNIAIETKGVFKFPPQNTSPIDASSQFGISGQVALDTPEENTSSGLFIVKGQFLRDEKLSLEQCEKITSLEQLNRYKEDVNPQGQRLNSEWYQ
ncbi:filamentous hemagglutinin N-terminal domain-containing protein [Candidatus Venteria ishoeyi]|uniref:two-partner secretion domain-containing protein n=1 Tax=Candidatus Venteria ishoeyi TaxID=1899563 RepID=UPI0025A563F0|nr:filamentous hemagglutinin N-terminal domain-containing protein [Candidatus Venteria ishoeyi]MDM8547214.1 filamentous hemagglutinin N-terminal domain-containing protein [Candidatus Venteria ishoeyi]